MRLSLRLLHLPATAQDAAPAAPKSSVVSDAQVEANVLKALASAPQLANQQITTTTVYGEVTLSGSVVDEPTRVMAETLASRAPGVKKVVDELTLSANQALTQGTSVPPDDAAMGTNPNLQSDGTMAPPWQQSPAPPTQRQPPDNQNAQAAPTTDPELLSIPNLSAAGLLNYPPQGQ